MTRRGRIGTATAMLALGISLVAAAPARAQEINLANLGDGAANRVYVRTGAEWAFVAGAGYARSVSVARRDVLLVGELTAPWTAANTSDYQARVGALAPIIAWRGLRLAGSLEPTVRGTKNDLGRMTALGANVGLTGGYYAAHWFLAGELGFDYALTTHVTHSRLYRDLVYENARDGWYVNPGGNYRLGGQAGASIGRYDVVLRAGVLRDMMGGLPLFPLYATVAVVASW